MESLLNLIVKAPSEPGILVNTAVVTGSNLVGTTSSAVVETVVETGTDVELSLRGPDEVSSGARIRFQLTVTNHGPLVATNVRVVLPIHPGIKLVDFFSVKGRCERRDPPPGVLNTRTETSCFLPEMAVFEKWIIEVNGEAGPLEAIVDSAAEVFIQQADLNKSNNFSQHRTAIMGQEAADISVRDAGGASRAGVFVYVSNDGPSGATNARLTVESAPGVELGDLKEIRERAPRSANCGGGESCSLDLGSMTNGDTREVEITFDTAANRVSFTFRAHATEDDPDPANNQTGYNEVLPTILTPRGLSGAARNRKLQVLEQHSPILPAPAAVTNSAAGNNFDSVSAGSGHTVWGTGFSSNVLVADGAERLPLHLEDVRVLLNGITVPLFFVAPNQINFQTPWELLGDALAEIRVDVAAATTMRMFARVAPYDPGIFTTNQSGSGQGAILIANSASVAAPTGMFPGSQPVARGGFISIFCNGLGPVSDPPPTGAGAWTDRLASTQTLPAVTIGGLDAPVFFSGLAPGFVGLYQVNAQIPQGAPVGDAVDLSVAIGGIESNGVTIAISE